jgi:hypothetical protein
VADQLKNQRDHIPQFAGPRGGYAVPCRAWHVQKRLLPVCLESAHLHLTKLCLGKMLMISDHRHVEKAGGPGAKKSNPWEVSLH